MTRQEQQRRDRAFSAAIAIARGSQRPPLGIPSYQAIAQIQLFFCGHGDGSAGAYPDWLEPTPAAATPRSTARHAGTGVLEARE